LSTRNFVIESAAAVGLLALQPVSGLYAGARADAPAAPTSVVSPASATVTQILALEKVVNDAYQANDLAAYFSYYWDDLTQWFPEGRVSLAEYKKSWTAYIDAGNRIESVKSSDMQVSVSPQADAAVVTYRLDVTTKLADGKITHDAFQETDVWFRRSGAWKIITLHYSPAGK
jgi:ketosteroid isomerase-like protein